MNIGDIVVRFSVGSVCSIVKVHGYVEIIHYLQITNDSNAEMVFFKDPLEIFFNSL